VTKAETLERESRWAVPVGIASIVGIILLIAAQPLGVGGDGQAELLREVDADRGSVLLSGLLQTLGFLLLTLPLVYLFRAVAARSDRVHRQLIGLVVAAPLFLALSAALTIPATYEAADTFLAGEADSTLSKQEAKEDCVEERRDEDAGFLLEEYEPAKGESPLRACEDRKAEDNEAANAQGETFFTPIAAGLGMAGILGFIVTLFYTGLWAMRTGLLSRFWGSLGMVAGLAFVMGPLSTVTAVWFVYFGMLVLGVVPGGKPPAWAAGEAIPWPTPGEKAAAEMEPEDGWDEEEPGPDPGGEKRKRKQRE
jgi:hypothetical protein